MLFKAKGKIVYCSCEQEDVKFLNTLFAQLTDDETGDEHRRDLVMFLKEFCTFSQTLQQPSRENFFKVSLFFSLITVVYFACFVIMYLNV